VTQAQQAPTRRGLLRGALAGAGALSLSGLTGCGFGSDPPEASVRRSAYGPDPSQYGELYLPGRIPLATVVVLHGGYWADGFGAEAMRPMCQALQADGYAVWNLEYRRIGGGGGWPATFSDAAAGIDHLNTFDTVDAAVVRVVGHSAGGQLAVWAASRRDTTPGGPSAVTVTRCVSLAGVLDLTTASSQGLGGGNVDRLMGGTPRRCQTTTPSATRRCWCRRAARWPAWSPSTTGWSRGISPRRTSQLPSGSPPRSPSTRCRATTRR